MSANTRPVQPRTIYLAAALVVVILLWVSIAFCLAASQRPPRLTMPRIQASDVAADGGEVKIMNMVDAPLGPFSLELTQEEATSLLALRLPGSPFLNPQVHFTGNKVYVTGDVSLGAMLKVVSMWSVHQGSGRPRVLLERASIGPFAMPPILLNSVSSTINEMIDESGTGIVPTSVRIEEGRIVVLGVKSTPTVP